MNVMEAILNRRSIRSYDASKPITDEDLKTVLTAAMYAPSAMNKRPWEFIVIRDKKILEAIRTFHPYAAFVSDAGCAIVICENTHNTYGKYGPIDTSLAAQNMMLAAYELGYGTCYCGTYTDELWVDEFKKTLNIPNEIIPFGFIVIGTALKTQNQPERVEEHKIHYNGW